MEDNSMSRTQTLSLPLCLLLSPILSPSHLSLSLSLSLSFYVTPSLPLCLSFSIYISLLSFFLYFYLSLHMSFSVYVSLLLSLSVFLTLSPTISLSLRLISGGEDQPSALLRFWNAALTRFPFLQADRWLTKQAQCKNPERGSNVIFYVMKKVIVSLFLFSPSSYETRWWPWNWGLHFNSESHQRGGESPERRSRTGR